MGKNERDVKNLFDVLNRGQTPETIEPLQTGPDPRTLFDALNQPSVRISGIKPTLGQEFLTGIGQEIAAPFKLFGVEGPEALPEDIELRRTLGSDIAKTAGQFVGLGVGFLPFLGVSSLALRSVGAYGKLPALARRLSTTSLAFGLENVGRQEELREAPRAFVTGTAFGLGADLAFIGAGKAIGKVYRTVRPPPPAPPNLDLINPDALQLMKQIFPNEGDDFTTMARKISEISNVDQQIDDLIVRSLDIYKTPGHYVLPGIKDPKRMEAAFKRNLRKPIVVEHFDEASDSYRMLVVEEAGLTKRQVELLKLKHGKLDFDDAVNIILEGIGPGGQRIDKVSFKKWREQNAAAPNVFVDETTGSVYFNVDTGDVPVITLKTPLNAMHHFALGGKRVAEGKVTPNMIALHLGTHEYSHFLASRLMAKKFGISLDDGMFKFTDDIKFIFDDFLPDNLKGTLSPDLDGYTKQGLTDLMAGVTGSKLDQELWRANLKFLTDWRRETAEAAIGMAAKTTDPSTVYKGKRYYLNAHELFANFVELMTYDPTSARNLAPNLTAAVEKMVAQESPHLERLLQGAWASKVGQIIKDLWVRTPTGARQFDVFPIAFGRKPKGSNALGQFRQYGHFKGEGVQSPDGEWWEITRFERASKDRNVLKALNARKDKWGREIQAGENYAVLRHQRSGRQAFASFDGFTSPTLANFVQRNQAMKMRATAAMSRPMEEAIVTLAVPGEDAVRKATIELKDFLPVRSLTRYWKDNLNELKAFAQRQGDKYKPIFEYVPRGKKQEFEDVLGTVRPGDADLKRDLIASYLQSQGKKGLVINEDFGQPLNKQIMSLLVADQKAVKLSPEVLSIKMAELETAGMAIDGTFREGQNVVRFLTLTNESRINSIAANVGVDQRDMAYFKRLVNEVTTDELTKVMDVDAAAMLKNTDGMLQQFGSGSGPEDTFARQGLDLAQDANGNWKVTDKQGGLLAMGPDKQEVEIMALKSAAPQAVKDLDISAQMPSGLFSGTVGNGTGPKYMEQIPLERSAGWEDRFTLFGAVITGMENFALKAEKAGFGPTWTRIFNPLQQGAREVQKFMFHTPRERLGGNSFARFLKDKVEKLAVKLPEDRQKLTVNLVEYLTADEIARPGGFLPQRGMNQAELAASARLRQLGVAHDAPRLLSVNRLGQRLLKNQEKFRQKALQMINDPQADPQTVALLKRMYDESLGQGFNSLDEIYAAIGLSEAQKEALKILTTPGDLDTFSKMVVIRHSNADKLEPGFKSGWDQFVARHKMNPLEQQLAKNLDELLAAAFAESGLEAKRQIKGYWPHMRQLMPFGIDLTDPLYKELPSFKKWAHAKIRTGELDPYSLDPVMVPLRYIRSLGMNKFVDPHLPDAWAAIKGIKIGEHGIGDVRIARIMQAYVDEIQGHPHATFEALNQLSRTMLKTLNAPKHLQENARFGESLTNAMVSLFSAATIPFRPGLIVRNYYQVPSMVPALTGVPAFWKAVQRSIGWDGRGFNRELMKSIYDDAIRANAIQKHTIPLEASTEIFSTDKNLLMNLTGGRTRKLAQLRRGFRYLVDKGFAWYQTADDWGRAVAFEGARIRIKQYENQLRTGKLTWERFLDKAGLRMYDDVEVEHFTRLYQGGQEKQAIDFVGTQAAGKTIFRYGHANHPAGWNSVPGRLFGQFGTWPVQYKDFVISGMSRGTTADKVNFAAVQLGTNGAILAGGAALGLNLTSWLTFPSIFYTGGPAVDIVADVTKMMTGSDTERRLAYQNLKYSLWPLEDGRSLVVPGSYFVGDLVDAYESGNIVEAFGFNLARPDPETHWLQKLFFGR